MEESEEGNPRQSADTKCYDQLTCGRKRHILRFCQNHTSEQCWGNSSPSVVKTSHSGTFEAPVIVSNLSVSCGKAYCIKRLILSVPVDFALDTTAVISLISKDV